MFILGLVENNRKHSLSVLVISVLASFDYKLITVLVLFPYQYLGLGRAVHKCFIGKLLSENFWKIHWKTSVHLPLNPVINFAKIPSQMFSREFCKFVQNSFFKEHLWATATARTIVNKHCQQVSVLIFQIDELEVICSQSCSFVKQLVFEGSLQVSCFFVTFFSAARHVSMLLQRHLGCR